MARLIDADALLEEHCDGCSLAQREECKADPVCASAMWIAEAPTVDAVPVVHCCDCQNCSVLIREVDGETLLFCEHWRGHPMVDPTDFCSYGERKNHG